MNMPTCADDRLEKFIGFITNLRKFEANVWFSFERESILLEKINRLQQVHEHLSLLLQYSNTNLNRQQHATKSKSRRLSIENKMIYFEWVRFAIE